MFWVEFKMRDNFSGNSFAINVPNNYFFLFSRFSQQISYSKSDGMLTLLQFHFLIMWNKRWRNYWGALPPPGPSPYYGSETWTKPIELFRNSNNYMNFIYSLHIEQFIEMEIFLAIRHEIMFMRDKDFPRCTLSKLGNHTHNDTGREGGLTLIISVGEGGG